MASSDKGCVPSLKSYMFMMSMTQLAFPFADHTGCQCISDHIGGCTEHIAKMIDRQDQRYTNRWYIKHGTGSQHHHQGSPWHTGNSFTREHQHQEHGQLGSQRKINAVRLCNSK